MDKKLYWASVVLALLGVVIAAYMTVYKITSNNKMCLGSGDCATVNNSKYSEVMGFPVAGVGVLGYIGIAGLLVLEKRGNKFFKENSLFMNFGIALIGFAFTIYLIYVELALIDAICPFCVASQVTMTLLFIATLIRLIKQFTD